MLSHSESSDFLHEVNKLKCRDGSSLVSVPQTKCLPSMLSGKVLQGKRTAKGEKEGEKVVGERG